MTRAVNPLTLVRDRSEMRANPAAGGDTLPAGRRTPRSATILRSRGTEIIFSDSGQTPESACNRQTMADSTDEYQRFKRVSTMKRAIRMLGLSALGGVVALGMSVGMASAQTLKTVKDRGTLICGVSQGITGFSNPDDKGNWT